MSLNRLDRQLRIEGWNQQALDHAVIGVVGDQDLLTSLFIMSASALGINHIIVIAPFLEKRLIEIAKKLNPGFTLTWLEGFYSHPFMGDVFNFCNLIVDLSHFGLANKLLLNKGYKDNIPVIRGFCYEKYGLRGFTVFTYIKDREWKAINRLISANNLPNNHFDNGVTAMIVAGIILEETKNILMGQAVSDELISYAQATNKSIHTQPGILVVGSGALGIFVGLGLAYSGFKHITFMDPDTIELTNLNRQVLFYDAIGRSKAETLAGRLNRFFDIKTRSQIAYFNRKTCIATFDVVFDCVDNYESKIILSEKCKDEGKVLISGGTSADAGQVVFYNPEQNAVTPSELLGLYDIVDKRIGEPEIREQVSCSYQPDPSVIMANQIIAGFMVEAHRIFLDGNIPKNIFYNSKSKKKI